jgi:hypothetical protein
MSNRHQHTPETESRLKGLLIFTACCLLMLFVCWLLHGCASAPTYPAKVGKSWCRHTALMAAAICGEFYPVRIVDGKTPNGGHAQAR